MNTVEVYRGEKEKAVDKEDNSVSTAAPSFMATDHQQKELHVQHIYKRKYRTKSATARAKIFKETPIRD